MCDVRVLIMIWLWPGSVSHAGSSAPVPCLAPSSLFPVTQNYKLYQGCVPGPAQASAGATLTAGGRAGCFNYLVTSSERDRDTHTRPWTLSQNGDFLSNIRILLSTLSRGLDTWFCIMHSKNFSIFTFSWNMKYWIIWGEFKIQSFKI